MNFRGTDDTITAVAGLQQLDWPADRLEIIVVENGSGDDSLRRLRSEVTGAVIVESKVNRGFAGGSNLGVQKSTGEYVAFLNNDARPDARWIAAAVAAFESSPRIGAVASKVLDWEGERVDYVDAALTWYGMGYKPHAGERDLGAWDTPKDVLFGTGAAMFVRAEVFLELGGFDEDYFMFYEDVDLGWRLNLLGYRFRYVPTSLAFHKHHASMEKFGAYRETYLLERNALYTLYKNLDDASLARVLPGALALTTRRAVGRGSLDSNSFDLRQRDDDRRSTIEVSKDTMAGAYAVDQFVQLLPALTEKRRIVQSTRREDERNIVALMGNTDEPAYPIDYYLDGYERIVQSLGQLDGARRRRVLVVTGDPIGARMAGPAIRAWNIALALVEEHDVRVASMASVERLDERIEVAAISHHRPESAEEHEAWCDVIIVQGHALELFPAFERSEKIVVVDLYDPLHLEQLEQGRNQPFGDWDHQVAEAVDALNHQLTVGDFFICASERQRHFWLGQLAAVGRINPSNYSRDNSLESLIAVVPFGISDEEPRKTAPAIKGVVPGIGIDDKVIVWGGGIYDWFDPGSLIRAVAHLAKRRPEVKLFFMGVRHPNPVVPEMPAVAAARSLAESLGVAGRNVFFNENWVPYEARQNYLLDADLGVSTHFAHVETTYSFRTRILDYLWAGLPIVTTEGDSFADLVGAEGLGAVVPERDVDALVHALEAHLFDSEPIATARANVARVRERFRWSTTLQPVVDFCREPQHASDRVLSLGKNKKKLKSRRGAGPVERARAPRRTGWRRDVDRVRYYLANGGPSAVVERWNARRSRKRDAS
ncbi:glycosyltransferase [Diaminobutyricimonas aerilata]|uniref:glycosyltransferase n=1 Tax=Diaminobutyricimonas aerilata TaxID=1162967 RepID=UPI001FE6D97B|nr:glycosyltransferase [Diaminobutyricimonas aerilata]